MESRQRARALVLAVSTLFSALVLGVLPIGAATAVGAGVVSLPGDQTTPTPVASDPAPQPTVEPPAVAEEPTDEPTGRPTDDLAGTTPSQPSPTEPSPTEPVTSSGAPSDDPSDGTATETAPPPAATEDDGDAGPADLTLEASMSPAVVSQDEVVTISIVVSNAGPGTDSGVTVAHVLPAGAVLQEAVDGLDAATGVLSIGAVAVGESYQQRISVMFPESAGEVVSLPVVDGDNSPTTPGGTETSVVEIVPTVPGGPTAAPSSPADDPASEGDGSDTPGTSGLTAGPGAGTASAGGQGSVGTPGVTPGGSAASNSGPGPADDGPPGEDPAPLVTSDSPGAGTGSSGTGSSDSGGTGSGGAGGTDGRPGDGQPGQPDGEQPAAGTGSTALAGTGGDSPAATGPGAGTAAEQPATSGSAVSAEPTADSLAPDSSQAALLMLGVALIVAGCVLLTIGGVRRTRFWR